MIEKNARPTTKLLVEDAASRGRQLRPHPQDRPLGRALLHPQGSATPTIRPSPSEDIYIPASLVPKLEGIDLAVF